MFPWYSNIRGNVANGIDFGWGIWWTAGFVPVALRRGLFLSLSAYYTIVVAL